MTAGKPKLQEHTEATPANGAGATAPCEDVGEDWGEDMGEYGDDYSWWTWPQDKLEEGDDIATLIK